MTETAETTQAHRRDVPLAVISVGMAVIVWWPAFTLGVWEDLFFDQLLTLWAASTAAFIFVLFERHPVGMRLLRAMLLLLPSVWLLLSFIDLETDDLFTLLTTLFALLVVIVASPLTVWVLARIMWPDFGQHATVRQKWMVVGVVLGIAVASFVLGVNHAAFLTCEDFAISGNSEPADCRPETE